jgi:hypothetical protein
VVFLALLKQILEKFRGKVGSAVPDRSVAQDGDKAGSGRARVSGARGVLRLEKRAVLAPWGGTVFASG